jgi:hypothetical protein
MSSIPVAVESDRRAHRYTNLFASISEEEDGYLVQVRLHSDTEPEKGAWGEETADSLESAADLIAALAAEFSIEQSRIKIAIRLHDVKAGTRH